MWALIYWAPAQITTLIKLNKEDEGVGGWRQLDLGEEAKPQTKLRRSERPLSLIHISEPTRPY